MVWTVDWGLKALNESEVALATITIDFYRLTERYLCRLHGVNLRPPNIFSLRRRWRRQQAATTGCAVCPSHSRWTGKGDEGRGRGDCVQAPLVIICKECRSALLVSANLSFAAAAAAHCDVVVGSAAQAGAAAWQVFFWLLAATTTTATLTAAAVWLLGLAFILLYPVGRWQSQQGMPSYAGAKSCIVVLVYSRVLVIDNF